MADHRNPSKQRASVVLPDQSAAAHTVASVGEVGYARRIKKASVIGIAFQFVLFTLVIPTPNVGLPVLEARAATVIKRYRPPKPKQPVEKRVIKKRRARPVPDPTPDEPEPIIADLEVEFVPEEEYEAEYDFSAPNGAPDAYGNAYEFMFQGLTQPRILEQPLPTYPRESARRGVDGTVYLEILIGLDGRVESARLIRGTNDDELNDAALQTVLSGWRFVPGKVGNEAVRVRANVEVPFRIW